MVLFPSLFIETTFSIRKSEYELERTNM